jgi:hypothetical protein
MIYEFEKEQSRELYWLTSIPSPKDDTRQHIRTILVKDGFAFKTNGAYLAWIPLEIHLGTRGIIEEGVYEVIKRTKTVVRLVKLAEEVNWPDLTDLLCIYKEESHLILERLGECWPMDYGIAKIFRKMPEETTFNIKLLTSILEQDVYDVFIQDEYWSKPMYLEGQNDRKFLLMTCREYETSLGR